MADPAIRREVERVLVAGSWDAVTPDNFRVTFRTEAQARDYVTEDIGFRMADKQLFGILRLRYAVFARPTGNRKGWEHLTDATRRNYAASGAAQTEARMHGMTVEEWYAVAPDLKAFRRKAKGRGKTGVGVGVGEVEFPVYIARKYKGLIEDPTGLSASIREAHQRNVEVFRQAVG